MSRPKAPAESDALNRTLALIEKLGNALPHPATLFALLAAAILPLSWALATLGVRSPSGCRIRSQTANSVVGLRVSAFILLIIGYQGLSREARCYPLISGSWGDSISSPDPNQAKSGKTSLPGRGTRAIVHGGYRGQSVADY